MTWNHPRGVDPLVAHAARWEREHGVAIRWDARSLEDFEAFPLDELAATYDLMVIDHPHTGMAAASGCLLPLDGPRADAFRGQTVGGSHETYHYAGHQWALAIDAATQVAARRAGALDAWPTAWSDVLALAREGRVLWPLAPVHAMMSFYTLSANAGSPCATEGDRLIDRAAGEQTLATLRELAALVPAECFTMNPIAVFERMAIDDRFAYSPLIYGYVSYATDGFRPTRIEFGNIAGLTRGDVRGSALGGTGIAVSAKSDYRLEATAVAFDLASADTQRTLYASSGGQPAHRVAWNDDAVNVATHGCYRNTIATLDAAYIRPRFDGYIGFQQAAGEILVQGLRGSIAPRATVTRINEVFAEAQQHR
jgi:multiple sugar transport system substrate-binding protein